MNNLTLIGRLTKQPEVKSGVTIVTIAVDKQLTKEKKAEMEAKNQATADFFSISVFGSNQNVCKYITKGNRVVIEASIHNNNYKSGDKTVYSNQIVARKITPIDWASSSSDKKEDGGKTKEKSDSDAFDLASDDFDFEDFI